MPKCHDCNNEIVNRYRELSKNFDKLTVITIIAVMVTLISLITTIIFALKVIRFINSIEIVEETCYEIEQDDGVNSAIIGNGNEVKLIGTDNNKED